MRFIYVGAFRLPNLDAAAPRVLTIGKMLRDCGHSVKYISWGGKYDEAQWINGKYYVDDFEYEISNELEILRNPVKRFRQWIARGKKSLKMIEKTDDYDAILAYQPSLYFLQRLKKICKATGKKLIVDITEWYASNELKLLDRPLQHYNMTVAIKSVENKILISSYLNKYYKGTNNVVIPATCDLKEPKWSKDSSSCFPSFDGLTLIYAGTPDKKDNLCQAVKAIERLAKENNPIRFYIFGVTEAQYKAQYGCVNCKSIIFMGRIPQEDIPGYYHQSDFMILLRDQTRKNMMGFPTKFTEAVCSGIPIITNATSDIPHYLINGYNGLLLNEPTEECLYNFLSKLILQWSEDDIKKLKINSYNSRYQLDYTKFVTRINDFILNLK